MTKNDIMKIRLIAGLIMLIGAMVGFIAIVCTVGFDLIGMLAAILMGLIGWDLAAFSEDYDDNEEDEDEYYE